MQNRNIAEYQKPCYNMCLYLVYEQILQQAYMYLYFNQDSLFKPYITVPKQDKKNLQQ